MSESLSPAVMAASSVEGDEHLDWEGLDVAEYPRFEFSMREVKRVGEMIAGELAWTDESAPKVKEAFQIANSWRDAHAYPMRSVRGQLQWIMRKHGLSGVTGARLKRMQAIRRKLRRLPESLNQLQDLGGCRVVLASIDDVRALVEALRNGSGHHLRHESPYIDAPKLDGYRSHHMMFNYRGKGTRAIYDNRRIEVQIRTRLQHSWATAVEAVGLLRGEHLKNDQGSPQWLRLFLLVSAEFAVAEGCPEPPNVPSRAARIAEIRALDKALKAAQTLDNLSYAVYSVDTAEPPVGQPTFFLLRFHNALKVVEVEPIFAPKNAVLSYDAAEAPDNKTGADAENIVLVEAGKLEDVKAAYPNYFGDVQLFRAQLNRLIGGKAVAEFTVRPQETVAPRPPVKPDASWITAYRRWGN